MNGPASNTNPPPMFAPSTPAVRTRDVLISELVDAGIAADPGRLEGFQGTGPADPIDIRKSDLQALVAREVDANQACHRAVLLLLRRSCAPPPVPARMGPRPPPGVIRGRRWGRSRIAVRVGKLLSPAAACAAGQSR